MHEECRQRLNRSAKRCNPVQVERVFAAIAELPEPLAALAAYSQQLRLELGPQGLHVLLVCPGPLARDTNRTYGADADPHLPPEAARPGGGVKTKAIDPADLAERILVACQRRRPEIVIPAKARLVFALSQLWPSLGDYLLRKFT